MSSSTEYHTFIPDPNGTCLICEKGEYEKEHLRTYAAARRDSIASKNISGGYRLETKTEHPEGEDKDPNASSDNGGAASATAADSSGGNSSSSSSGKTRNDADEGDDDGNDRRNVADDAEDEIELIDDDNSIYSWGESSRLGPCKNEYYRDNKEHKDASVRKTPGTHLSGLNRSTHPESYKTALQLGHQPRGKTMVQIAASEKHTLMISSCGQIHAFKQCEGVRASKENTVERIYLRVQVMSVSCGTSHFFAVASLPQNNLVGWGMNSKGQLGFPVKGTKKKSDDMFSTPTILELSKETLATAKKRKKEKRKRMKEKKKKRLQKSTTTTSSWFSFGKQKQKRANGEATHQDQKVEEEVKEDEKEEEEEDVPPFLSVTCGPETTFAIGSDGRLWSWGYDGKTGVLGKGRTQLHFGEVKWRYSHDSNLNEGTIRKSQRDSIMWLNNMGGGVGGRESTMMVGGDGRSGAAASKKKKETKEEKKKRKKKQKQQQKQQEKKGNTNDGSSQEIIFLPTPNDELMIYLNLPITTSQERHPKQKKKISGSAGGWQIDDEDNSEEENKEDEEESDEDEEEEMESLARASDGEVMFRRAFNNWSEHYCRRVSQSPFIHPTEWPLRSEDTAHSGAKLVGSRKSGGEESGESKAAFKIDDEPTEAVTFSLVKCLHEEEKFARVEKYKVSPVRTLAFKGCLNIRTENRATFVNNILLKTKSRGSSSSSSSSSRRSERTRTTSKGVIASLIQVTTDNLSQKVDPTKLFVILDKKKPNKKTYNMEKKVIISSLTALDHDDDDDDDNDDDEQKEGTMKRKESLSWMNAEVKPSLKRIKEVLQQWSTLDLVISKIGKINSSSSSSSAAGTSNIAMETLIENPTREQIIRILKERQHIQDEETVLEFKQYELYDKIFHLNGMEPYVSFGAYLPISSSSSSSYIPDVPIGPNMKGVALQHGWIIYVLGSFWYVHNAQGKLPKLSGVIHSTGEKVVDKQIGKQPCTYLLKQSQGEDDDDDKDSAAAYQRITTPSEDEDFVLKYHPEIFKHWSAGRNSSSRSSSKSSKSSSKSNQYYVRRLNDGDLIRVGEQDFNGRKIQMLFKTNEQMNVAWKEYEEEKNQFENQRDIKSRQQQRGTKTRAIPPKKPYYHSIHAKKLKQKCITALTFKGFSHLVDENENEDDGDNGASLAELLSHSNAIIDSWSAATPTLHEKESKTKNKMAAATEEEDEINPLTELTIGQRTKISEIAERIDFQNSELLETEALILDLRQKPGTAKKRKKSSRRKEGASSGVSSAAVVNGRNDAAEEINSIHSINSNLLPSSYEHDTTKLGALELVQDKEVARTQYKIAMLRLLEDIFELESKVKEEETTLQQNMYMVTKLRTEQEGIQTEVDTLPVTDPSISRKNKEIQVREDMLQSRQTLHTSIARTIGEYHEKIQKKRHEIQAYQIQINNADQQIAMLNDLLVQHDACLRHELIRQPNEDLNDMMRLAKSTIAKLNREDVSTVLRDKNVIQYFSNTSSGYHQILSRSTKEIHRIMKEARKTFDQEYFSGNELLHKIAVTVLHLVEENASARIRRNMFIEGLIVQKTNEEHRKHEDLLNDALEHHLSDPEMEHRRMKETESGY